MTDPVKPGFKLRGKGKVVGPSLGEKDISPSVEKVESVKTEGGTLRREAEHIECALSSCARRWKNVEGHAGYSIDAINKTEFVGRTRSDCQKGHKMGALRKIVAISKQDIT